MLVSRAVRVSWGGRVHRVALTITAQAVSVWSVQTHAWVKAPGTFDVAVGSSVADVRFHHKFVVQ